MANNGQIKYGIGFNVDKTGLNQLKAELQQIKNMTVGDLVKLNPSVANNAVAELEKIKASARQLEGALERSFNPNLGTLNVTKFNQELKKINVNKIYKDLSQAGTAGKKAFRDITTQVLTTNMQLKQTHTLLDSMAETMGNTIKWGIASSALNNFTGGVQKAYGYVKNLDTSLNNIRIVTEKSAEEMDKFAVKANNAAKSLGQSTTAYTDAALIYYQQGLAEEEVLARADTTLKAANVTGQAAADVSEQLTAVWNGFQVGAEETELYVDKLAAVAATTAADLEELSTGMSKVASAANAMGVDIDQLNGHLATVVSVTRQAPESVGTAFKTIYARLGDLAVGGEDEFGVKLGDVSGKLQQMGIEILDQQGNMRDMGTVMEEVAEKWDGWTESQRQAAAVAMAGKRQYNNLIALFDNWDMYTDAVNTSKNAMGTLQTQQDIYMESTEAHLEQMGAAAEDLYDSLLNAKGINSIIDGLTSILNLSSNFVDSIGGASGVLMGLGSVGLKVFNKQITESITTSINNLKIFKAQTEALSAEMEILERYRDSGISDSNIQALVKMKEQELQYSKSLTVEERNQSNEFIKRRSLLVEQKEQIEGQLEAAKEFVEFYSTNTYDISTEKGRQSLEASLFDTDPNSIQGELQDWSNDYKASEKAIKEHIQALEELKKTRGQLTEGSEEYIQTNQEIDEVYSRQSAEMQDIVAVAEDLIFTNKLQGAEVDALRESLDAYQIAVREEGTDQVNNIRIYNRSIEVMKNYHRVLEKANDNLRIHQKNTKNFSQRIQENANDVENLSATWQKFLAQLDLKNKIQQLVTFTSHLSSIGMAINSISSLKDILDNEDLSTAEKLSQVLMNVSTILIGLKAAYDALVMTKGLFTSTTLLNTIAIIAEGKAEATNSKEKLKAALASEFKAQMLQNETRELTENTLAEIQNAAAKKASDVVDQVGAKNAANHLLGLKLQNSALLKLITTYGKFLGIAGLVLGGIALAYNYFTKEQQAAEKAAEAVNEQTEAVNALKSAHQEVNNSIQAYKDAQEQLNGLKKGTIEWTNALLDANGQVLSLLDKFPGLINYIRNVDGKLEIVDGGFEHIANEQANQLLQAQRALMITQRNSAEQNVKASKEEFRNSFGDGIDMATANKISAAIESQGTDWLADDAKIKSILGVTDSQVKAIKENSQEIIELAGELAKNTEAERLYAEMLADSYLAEDDDFQEAANKDAIRSGYSIALENGADLALTAWNNKSDDVVQKAYMEAIGATEVDNTADGKAKYKIGESWKEIDDETARQFLATRDAAANLEDYAKHMESALNKLDISDKLEGIFTEMSKSNIENVDLSNLNRSELLELFTQVSNKEFTEKEAAALGYDSVKEMKEAIVAAITEGYNNAIEKQAESIKNIQQNVADTYLADDTEAQYAWNNFQNSKEMKNFTIDGMNLANFFGDIPAEEILNKIDWSKMPTAPEKMADWYAGALKDAREDVLQDRLKEETNTIVSDEGLDSKAIDKYAEELQDLAEAGEGVDESLKEDVESARHLGATFARIQKGVQELSESFDEQRKVLEDTSASEDDKAKALAGLRESIGDLLDLDASTLSDDFLTNAENLDLMARAAQGDAEAIDQLRLAAANDILLQTNFENIGEDLKELHNKLTTYAADNNLVLNADIEDQDFIDKLNKMIAASGMTAEQVNEYLDTMGYEPVVETIPAEVGSEMKMPVTSYKIGWSITDGITLTPHTTYDTVKAEGSAGVPVIRSMRYKGSASTALNANVGKATTKSTPTSSGGGSSSKPKTEKNSTLKKDIYHDINQELSGLNKEFERLSKAQDKLFGKSLIDNLNKQLKIIEKQKDATKRKLDIAKQEQALLRKQLEQQGVTFNEDGLISNYMTILDKKQAEYNELVKKYNTMSADGQEAFQSTLDAAKEELELLNENIERYDELSVDEIPGLVDEITDMAYQEIELRLEKMNAEIEIKLDLSQAIQDWAEFEREVIKGLEDTDFLGYAQSAFQEYKDLIGTGAVELLTQNLNSTIAEIDAYNKDPENYHGTFASQTADGTWVVDEQAMMDKLKTDQESLMNYLTDLHNKQEEINQAYLDNIDKISEAYQEQQDLFSFIDDQLNHSVNVIKLLKGEEAYEDMAQFYDQKIANNEALLAAQVQERDYYKQMMEQETDPEARKKWEELWMDSVQKVNTTVEESLQIINDNYVNSVKEALKEIDDALGGTRTIKAKWDVAVDQDSRWMDGVNKAYNLATLENKFNESINSVDSIKGQRELNKLKEQELEKLREKDKLTQYDVDRANQLLDIEMKRIALEEAQKNKSKMRLRRDASGNYSYQFVADEEAQAQAQQELMDAQNSLYNMDKDHLREQQQELFAVWQEYQDLQTEYASLSIEERERRQEEYAVKFANLQQNMTDISRDCEWTKQNLAQSTYDSLNLMYEEDGLTFSELNAEKQRQLTEELGPTFRDTIDTMIDAINNPEEGYEAAWLRADEKINQANEEVRIKLATIESTLGLTPEEGLRNTTSSYYTEAIGFAEDLAKKQGENILKYQGEQLELGKVKKALELVTKAWEGTYNASVQALGKAQEYITAMLNQKTATEAAIEAQEDLAEAVRDVGKALQEVAAIKASSGTGNSVTGNNGSGGGGGGGGGGGNNSTQTEAPHANQTRQAYKYQNGHMVQLNYKTVGPYIVGEPKKVKMTPGSNKETKFYKTSQSNVWFKYKKGGLADYTGPAWLDGTKSQPELVLNAHDTENMLAMVKMVRELMKGSSVSVSQSDSPETKLFGKIKLLTSLVQELRDSANIRTENLIALADITNKINKAEELSLAEKYEHDKALLAIQQEQLFASWEQIQRFTAGVDAAVKEINTDSIAKFNQTAEILKAMTAKQDKYNDLLQDIKIYADFPDATNADEIKAAFNNLALTASQRAYSTKK